jgi:hypothetical protein
VASRVRGAVGEGRADRLRTCRPIFVPCDRRPRRHRPDFRLDEYVGAAAARNVALLGITDPQHEEALPGQRLSVVIICIVGRACPFCDRPADSADHADPQWMSRYYLDRDPGVGSFAMSFGGLYPDRAVPLLNQTIRVCQHCNGGWMAVLEDRVKPALIAMSNGEGLIVGPDGQRVLAQWLLKNALVRELATPQGSLLRISTHDQRKLVAKRGIPDGWRVGIAAYEGPGTNLAHTFSGVKQYVGDDGQRGGKAILHTLRFECFVGQVLVHSMLEPPNLAHLLGGPPYVVEIPQLAPVTWPPPATLTPTSMATVREFGPTPA